MNQYKISEQLLKDLLSYFENNNMPLKLSFPFHQALAQVLQTQIITESNSIPKANEKSDK